MFRKSERFRRLRRKLNESKFQREVLSAPINARIDGLLDDLHKTYHMHHEFLQAFTELTQNIRPAIARQPQLYDALNTLREPERLVDFTIKWTNETGDQMLNRGWRCEYSTVLGPPRGGIRLHPTCSESVIKFLGLELTVKNALLNMPMGGGHSGANFDARNASDGNVRAFIAAFVIELHRNCTVPFDIVGDLGCGHREISMIAAAYKHLTNTSIAASIGNSLTSSLGSRSGSHKGLGISSKPWATGMGAVEFAKRLMKLPSFDKRKCIVSGSGDAALSVARNLIGEGAKVLTLSDSGGYVYVSTGMTFAQWQRIADRKKQQMRLHEMVQEDGWLEGLQYRPGSVWSLEAAADYAFPCTHENEITEAIAYRLVKVHRIKTLIEVANMPCTTDAYDVLDDHHIRIVPYKACNIGAMVAIGLNVAEQTPMHEFEHRVRVYVGFVHDQINVVYEDYYPDLRFDAAVDICGFMRFARALYDQGS